MCTVAEVKSYFRSITEEIGSTNYLKPNKNCNLTSWGSGCEPGWACSTGTNEQVDLRNSQDIPARTTNCQACCEGFFCPQGITCMIRKCLRIFKMSSFLEDERKCPLCDNSLISYSSLSCSLVVLAAIYKVPKLILANAM